MGIEITVGINAFRIKVDKDSAEDKALQAALINTYIYYRHDCKNGKVFFSFLGNAKAAVAKALGLENL